MRLTLALLLLCGPQETSSVAGKVSAPEGAAQKRLRAKIRYAGPGIELHKPPDPSPAVVWLEKAPAAKVEPRTVEIRQEGLELRPRVVAIPVGSTVKFPNADDVFHNVFSFSKAKRFDLGRYPKGESKSETFDARGQVDLRCEVHDHIRGFVHVFDHPYYAVAAEDGSYAIPKVPPGKYTLVAWKEFFEPVRQEIEVKADGAKVDVTMARSDDRSPDPDRDRPAERKVGGACCDAR
jgi:plastocyanin